LLAAYPKKLFNSFYSIVRGYVTLSAEDRNESPARAKNPEVRGRKPRYDDKGGVNNSIGGVPRGGMMDDSSSTREGKATVESAERPRWRNATPIPCGVCKINVVDCLVCRWIPATRFLTLRKRLNSDKTNGFRQFRPRKVLVFLCCALERTSYYSGPSFSRAGETGEEFEQFRSLVTI